MAVLILQREARAGLVELGTVVVSVSIDQTEVPKAVLQPVAGRQRHDLDDDDDKLERDIGCGKPAAFLALAGGLGGKGGRAGGRHWESVGGRGV